jgi:hypothetical protein
MPICFGDTLFDGVARLGPTLTVLQPVSLTLQFFVSWQPPGRLRGQERVGECYHPHLLMNMVQVTTVRDFRHPKGIMFLHPEAPQDPFSLCLYLSQDMTGMFRNNIFHKKQ